MMRARICAEKSQQEGLLIALFSREASQPRCRGIERERKQMDTLKPIWRTKTDPGTAGRKGPMPFNVGLQRYHRTPQRHAPSVVLFLGAWILALFPVVQPVNAQETSEVAKQAQNPIASIISVPIESAFNPQTGIKKQDSYVLE